VGETIGLVVHADVSIFVIRSGLCEALRANQTSIDFKVVCGFIPIAAGAQT
jgi:hypothetical protein